MLTRDSYLLAGGIPLARPDHAVAVADVAIEMSDALTRLNREHGTALKMRVGISTGPIVAGVIGKRKFTYALWGDPVNLARRMESSDLPRMIHLSENTYQVLKEDCVLVERGITNCKGIGDVLTCFLKERRAKV